MTEKALEGLKGVERTTVRYWKGVRGSVRFRYDPTITDISTLQSAVEGVNSQYRVVLGSPETVPSFGSDIDFRVHSFDGLFSPERGLSREKNTLVLFFEGEGWSALGFEAKVEPIAQKEGFSVRVVYLQKRESKKNFETQFEKKGLPYFRYYREFEFVAEGHTIAEVEALFP